MLGLNGDDLRYGSTGHAYLTGGAGKDMFLYRSRGHSEADPAKRDTIYDFSSSDKIDLAGVDANHLLSGNQAFIYIGKSAFHAPPDSDVSDPSPGENGVDDGTRTRGLRLDRPAI